MKKRIVGLVLTLVMLVALLPVVPVGASNMGKVDEHNTISAGGILSVIKEDGSLWDWGSNLHGQLGDGTTKARYTMAKIMDNVMSVSNAGYHTMAIKTDGTLWGWGGIIMDNLGTVQQKIGIHPLK